MMCGPTHFCRFALIPSSALDNWRTRTITRFPTLITSFSLPWLYNFSHFSPASSMYSVTKSRRASNRSTLSWNISGLIFSKAAPASTFFLNFWLTEGSGQSLKRLAIPWCWIALHYWWYGGTHKGVCPGPSGQIPRKWIPCFSEFVYFSSPDSAVDSKLMSCLPSSSIRPRDSEHGGCQTSFCYILRCNLASHTRIRLVSPMLYLSSVHLLEESDWSPPA